MSNHTLSVSPERAATLNVREAAALLNISQRHLWALNASSRLPPPIRLGRAVRWLRADLEAWLAAGAPTADKWLAMKAGPAR